MTARSTQDERIAEEFRAIEAGRKSKDKIVEIEGDVPIGMKMRLGEFAEAISTRVWGNVGRANLRLRGGTLWLPAPDFPSAL
jgi:hypothetical protein